jgi:hypothetical protein
MSVDPVIGDLTDPQSWNRYSYTLNNPFKYVDPDGEAAIRVQGLDKIVESTIAFNSYVRGKLDFVPNLILDAFLPVDPGSVASGFLLGPQAIEAGVISKAVGIGGLRRSAIISYERAEKYLVSKGFDISRAKSFIESFEGSITARIVEPGEQSFRYTGKGGSKGSFLVKSIFGSSEEAVSSLNLAPYGNMAELRQTVTATKRSIVLEGGIKGGASGTRQTLIIDREAFGFDFGERF